MYIEVIKVLPNVDFYSKFSWDFNQRYLVEETKLVSHPTVFPKVLFLFFFTWTEIPTYRNQYKNVFKSVFYFERSRRPPFLIETSSQS